MKLSIRKKTKEEKYLRKRKVYNENTAAKKLAAILKKVEKKGS